MKILLLTSIYPIPGVRISGATDVCHYFAKEWVRQGHEVAVVNTYTVYPRIFHWLSGVLRSKIANYCTVSINEERYDKSFTYEMDGVRVLLAPTFKKMPRGIFPEKSVRRLCDEVTAWLEETGFTPDVITGHFIHPSLQLIPMLKERLGDIPSGIVLHGRIRKERDERMIAERKDAVDFWGFRSVPIGESFRRRCFDPSDWFLCQSGVPEEYIREGNLSKHDRLGVRNFLYVGNLMQRKHPEAVLEALAATEAPFSLTYLGDGEKGREIKALAARLGLSESVKLPGRVPRAEVSERMDDAECFIMISEQETFGLVYLEAMAAGCITVASRGEGMDGIIADGANGFLCAPGDARELASVLKRIGSLTPAEKKRIAENAIATARNMTDGRCSARYAENLASAVAIKRSKRGKQKAPDSHD